MKLRSPKPCIGGRAPIADKFMFHNYNYRYNGLSDRVQQTVNGVTTTYVLDLNTGLTQVLSDWTDTYLYGLSRIGEEDTSWDYYLGDALGSVRQLTDGSGDVSLVQTFEPYGKVWASLGMGSSSYAFTGEVQDQSGLIFLRARYVNPSVGRFITRDTWTGDYKHPLSLNRWGYVQGNPINLTDPSGLCIKNDKGCENAVRVLESTYAFTLYWPERENIYPEPVYPPDYPVDDCEGFYINNYIKWKFSEKHTFSYWSIENINTLAHGLNYISKVLGYHRVRAMTSNGVLFRYTEVAGNTQNEINAFYCNSGNCTSAVDPTKSRFSFNKARYAIGFSNLWSGNHFIWTPGGRKIYTGDFTVIHEFGHRLNYVVGSEIDDDMFRTFYTENTLSPKAPSDYATENSMEYFAETFAFYIWDHAGFGKYPGRSNSTSIHTIFSDRIDPQINLHDYFQEEVINTLP